MHLKFRRLPIAFAVCRMPPEGPFAFSLTGVLASFLNPLAEGGVPIFAASTFDTDYILVKEEHAAAALKTLQDAGHELVPD